MAEDRTTDPSRTTDADPSRTQGEPTPEGGSGGAAGGSGGADDTAAELERLKAENAEKDRKLQQLLSEKTNTETARREAEERQEQERRLQTEQDRVVQEQHELTITIARLQHRSTSAEYNEEEREDAREKLVILKQSYRNNESTMSELRKMRSENALSGISDAEERAAVKQYMEAGYDPVVARRAVRGQWLEEGKLKAPPAAEKEPEPEPARRTVSEARTTLRGVPAKEHEERLGNEEIAEKAAELAAAGRTEDLRKLYLEATGKARAKAP